MIRNAAIPWAVLAGVLLVLTVAVLLEPFSARLQAVLADQRERARVAVTGHSDPGGCYPLAAVAQELDREARES